MKPKIDWMIELLANGCVCQECGKVEFGFRPYLCDAHTRGMNRYGHPEFQMVLHVNPEEICRILNTLGLMVQSGHKFSDNEFVSEIYEDCVVQLKQFWDENKYVYRVIIPDKNNVFPEKRSCEYPYSHQLLPTHNLYVGRNHGHI